MIPNRILPPATLRRFALVMLAMLPIVAGCGGKKADDAKTDADANPPTAPVEQLYNNGMDALNDKRYASAGDQFAAVQQNYPYSTWAVNSQLM
ncbi:MAG TPA: outer membrane protein assembly factor BamD, partial [Acetobacteraceae bacterium]